MVQKKSRSKYQSNYAFIDSQNLNLGIRNQGWVLDLKKFREFLKHKFKVDKAYVFLGYIESNQKLYKSFENSGYKIIFKPVLKGYEDEYKVKGNTDAELVLEAMKTFSKYDKAIIVSGDGDFHCLINYLNKKRKLERLIIPNKNKYSKLLKSFNKRIFFMEKRLNLEYVKG